MIRNNQMETKKLSKSLKKTISLNRIKRTHSKDATKKDGKPLLQAIGGVRKKGILGTIKYFAQVPVLHKT